MVADPYAGGHVGIFHAWWARIISNVFDTPVFGRLIHISDTLQRKPTGLS
jgi:hypothetical protein